MPDGGQVESRAAGMKSRKGRGEAARRSRTGNIDEMESGKTENGTENDNTVA